MYEYFVTPKRVNLISTRSQTPYWDRLIILVELQSKKLKEGKDAFKLWWTLPAYLGYAATDCNLNSITNSSAIEIVRPHKHAGDFKEP